MFPLTSTRPVESSKVDTEAQKNSVPAERGAEGAKGEGRLLDSKFPEGPEEFLHIRKLGRGSRQRRDDADTKASALEQDCKAPAQFIPVQPGRKGLGGQRKKDSSHPIIFNQEENPLKKSQVSGVKSRGPAVMDGRPNRPASRRHFRSNFGPAGKEFEKIKHECQRLLGARRKSSGAGHLLVHGIDSLQKALRPACHAGKSALPVGSLPEMLASGLRDLCNASGTLPLGGVSCK